MGGCGGRVEQVGVVLSLDGDTATLRMRRAAACSGDHAGCPWSGAVGRGAEGEFTITAFNRAGAKPGDPVKVDVAAGDYCKALFLVFVLPILGILCGYLAGAALAVTFGLANHVETVAGIMAAVGFFTAYFAFRRAGKRFKPQYVITRIINPK